LTIRPARVEEATAVAALHATRIPEGFLVTLGSRFLARLYRRMAKSSEAFLLVAPSEGDHGPTVSGFIGVATDTRRFYREFVRKDAVMAAVASAPAIARNPKHVWETLRYGTVSSEEGVPAAEVLSVAVAADSGAAGLGGALVRAAQHELQRRAVTSARVVTAAGNLPALRMYERAGFRHHHHAEVHTGVIQEVLVWP
jgi:ribosomal protein S18 acetylase RimI-like enzyme